MRWFTLILVAVAIGGLYLARHQLSGLASRPAVSASRIEADDDATSRIFAGGTVEGTHRELALKFEVAGRLKEVLVKAGSHVSKGDVLAQLDAELSELKFIEARTLLKLARAERDRIINSSGKTRQDDLTIAETKVELAEGALRRERIMLEKTALVAPTDGIVLCVHAEPGELVGPSDSRELLTLVNHERTRVRAYVEELDALNVSVGQKVIVTADGKPDKPYTGVVRSCSPYVAPKSHRHLKPGELVDIRVREVMIELADGADLLIGLPVDVFIEPRPSVVPGSASPYDDAQRAGDPQTARKSSDHSATTADARPALGRTAKRIADSKFTPAGHQ